MNPRHGAALALVGWYLMMPPTTPGPGGQLLWQSAVPLSQWQNAHSFDSAEQCEKYLYARRADAYAKAGSMSAETAEGTKNFVNAAVCVSSDDPRLKAN
jgi:hypothetical protein